MTLTCPVLEAVTGQITSTENLLRNKETHIMIKHQNLYFKIVCFFSFSKYNFPLGDILTVSSELFLYIIQQNFLYWYIFYSKSNRILSL